MREVCAVSCGGDVSDDSNCKNMLLKSASPGIKMSPTPGYLELSPEKMKALICQTPIEEFYDVEDQPFARGKYAAVRRCRHRESGRQYAAKFLKKSRRSADLRPEIIHEVAILDACAGSSRIVRLQQVFESQHEMVLLLELAPGGELQMLLDNDEVPEEVQVKKLMKQILDGLVFLHSINVAHLDLKPQNLVLTGEFPHCDVKLCDLGISRYISDGADIRDILGTPDYVAPEVLNYEPISLATDMWSVGVLLYVLLTGCSPFGGDTKQETFCNISQCKLDFPEDLFEEISSEAIDLMKKLMVKDPSKRLDARQCLQHRWFASGDTIAKGLMSPTRVASPLVARKPEVCRAVASPKLKHRAPAETPLGDKAGDFCLPRQPEGIKASRRDNFRRNLSALAERLTETSSEDSRPPTVLKDIAGSMRRAKSMHLLPQDCLYSFRRCLVTEEEELSPPQSIAGSVTSSLYSDQSISDSGSDRSSIISLDEGLDYKRGSNNVWNRQQQQQQQRRVNESFASAFLRFSSGAGTRMPARGAQTGALGQTRPACRVEFRKERFGNVVVIREVRAGRFLQVNELKCDSIQARIRRLQVGGVQKT